MEAGRALPLEKWLVAASSNQVSKSMQRMGKKQLFSNSMQKYTTLPTESVVHPTGMNTDCRRDSKTYH